jgi:hypothetical protein
VDRRRWALTKDRAADLRGQIEARQGTHRYWPQPRIPNNPNFQSAWRISELVPSGDLDPACAGLRKPAWVETAPEAPEL